MQISRKRENTVIKIDLEERSCRHCGQKYRVMTNSIQFVCSTLCNGAHYRWGGGPQHAKKRKQRRAEIKKTGVLGYPRYDY